MKILRVWAVVSLWLQFASPAYAAAPLRANQPYAEATKCADPNVILCEDFDYPQDHVCGSTSYQWLNPALISGNIWSGFASPDCVGKVIEPASTEPPQPAGSPQGGYVKRINDLMKTGDPWGTTG